MVRDVGSWETGLCKNRAGPNRTNGTYGERMERIVRHAETARGRAVLHREQYCANVKAIVVAAVSGLRRGRGVCGF